MPKPIVAYWDARRAYWDALSDDVRITIGLAVLAALLLAIAIWWLWWRLPKREAARLALTNDPKERADLEDDYRKTIGQALGGIVVLLGAGVAYLQFSQQQQAHDLLISNQVSKGFEQLGNKDAIVVRLGGIYALEGVMNNSDQYHRPVLEALSAFVREGAKLPTMTPTPGPLTQRLPTDIQAALTVIGRRSGGPGIVDLTNADIAGADLIGANLTHAQLSGATLIGAKPLDAQLSGANLFGADLTDAKLVGANLVGANLTGANLTDAELVRANLTGADLRRADLTHANLTGADLTGAHLAGAHLAGAHLGAHLDGQKQLDEACGSDALLPAGLTLKPCP